MPMPFQLLMFYGQLPCQVELPAPFSELAGEGRDFPGQGRVCDMRGM